MDKKKEQKPPSLWKQSEKLMVQKFAFVHTKWKKCLSPEGQLQSQLAQGSQGKGWACLQGETNKNGNGRQILL